MSISSFFPKKKSSYSASSRSRGAGGEMLAKWTRALSGRSTTKLFVASVTGNTLARARVERGKHFSSLPLNSEKFQRERERERDMFGYLGEQVEMLDMEI